MSERRRRGVFCGLATLDIIHRVITAPGVNEKVTAREQFVAAGGPAANAAVTFAALGGEATLLTALGAGPIAEAITAELAGVGVQVMDIAPELIDAAPVSSVMVTESTGERSVVGADAAAVEAPAPSDEALRKTLDEVDVVLIDGHHPHMAKAAADAARKSGLPTVIDAGRWKPAMADVLSRATDVVASADFRMPGSSTSAHTAAQLVADGCPVVVTTAGAEPVQWWAAGAQGSVAVPTTIAVDTLGAGDVFHGAYAYALSHGEGVASRIAFANAVAATRCAHIGPRSWLKAIALIPVNQGDR